MTVIAFRPRPRPASPRPADVPVPLVGTFRAPSGRMGHLVGSLRVHRLVIIPRGTFVTGVFTGELRDHDGSLVGVDTRRATIAADLVRQGEGYLPVLRPFQLDLMGITVDVAATTIDPTLAPTPAPGHRRLGRGGGSTSPRGVPS
jgi:hypothetical protein